MILLLTEDSLDQIMMKMKWRNPFLQFALGVIGIAHAFSSGFATPRQTTQLFVSVLEERDDSIANYLNGANVETMQALLQVRMTFGTKSRLLIAVAFAFLTNFRFET